MFSLSFRSHILIGALIRGCLIAYGEYVDRFSSWNVKYTDVDYRVLTDGARWVLDHNESPYRRHGYRYTPLLAWILTPNLKLHSSFGKILFSLGDLGVAGLLKALLDSSSSLYPLVWLYNPLTLGVSTRGNAESLLLFTILLSFYLFKERVFFLSGIAFALSIHLKLYPIVYSLAFYNVLTGVKGFKSLFALNTARFRFVSGTVFTLAILTGIFYYLYGYEFLEESYFYHFGRRDTRHNFSVYFYMLYLTSEDDDIGIRVLTFLPQLLLFLGFVKKFGNWRDLPFCLFCQTFVFVTYNKVVTSQYFLWYLGLLPLVLPRLNLSKSEALSSALLWGFAQGSWLLPAYFLEFRGYNTFQFVWIESLAFFCANIGLLSKFIRKYRELNYTEPVSGTIKKTE